ncbi:Lateral signaling target protein 2-like protein [Zootermopsis nevadensis]|uniref:Lateral signaling target protein 2 homolog n=2 Tax=Zootermopsis nevadensis TaxID=136037 RepID=A0A067RKS4_ZOONE|nr:Lateral signaling target protein 2-like protein [Zootermopsis nevadensis]
MDDVIPTERANRDFRVKFPDDVMQENLAGQLWFGAECLAAGSSIMNREGESSAMRPLAKALTKALENVRNLLREQCLRGNTSNLALKPNLASGINEVIGERLQEALKIFDRLFAEFELCYVSAMVPVKSTKEYELQQLVVVLFSETLQRALKMNLLTEEMVDDYDPALMFTIPRLAIVSGLLIFPEGPLCLDRTPADMSEMFRPFRTLLHKIRELLWTLNSKELFTLEKFLCSSEEPIDFRSSGHSVEIDEAAESVGTANAAPSYPTVPDLDDFVTRFYIDYPSCKQFVTDFYASTSSRNVGEIQDPLNNGVNENISRIELCASVTNIFRTEEEAKVCDSEVVPSWESTEESEDETEYVGETSECETVVTGAYESEEITSSVENDGNTLTSLPEDFPTEYSNPELGENLVLGERLSTGQQSASSSSSCASNLDFQMKTYESARLTATTVESQYSDSCSHLPYSDTIKIPTPSVCGFLLANQVGHESMLAHMERITSPRMPDLSPGAGGSLPDGDSREALSVATATLSTLLLSSPNVSPVGDVSNDIEEDSSIQSPLDSGVGTVVSYSDTGSFSDRSPDTASAPSLISSETKMTENSCTAQTCCNNAHKCQQQWQVETIPCSCTLSDRPAVSSNPSRCVNELQNCSAESYSSVSTNTGGGSCQDFDVDGCFITVVRTCNDDICDTTVVDSGENIVAFQDCFLTIEADNVDKEDLISSDVGSFKVLSDGDKEFANFTSCSESKRDRVFCNETTTRNFSPTSSSFQNNSQETNVLMSHNVGNFSYGAANVSNAASCNIDIPQEFEENTDDPNGGEIYKRTVGLINDVPVTTFQLNGSNKDMVVTSSGRHEQNKTLPCIVVKVDGEQDKGGSEKWFGVANGECQCSLCSINNHDGAQSQTSDCLLNSAGNWEHRMIKQQSEVHDSGLECATQISSHLAQKTAEIGRIVGNRNVFLQTSSSQNVASDTNNQPGGSTLAVIPSQSGRSLDVPLASSFSSTSSSCQSSVTVSSDSCSMSSDTSSFNSECQDDEEIALAMQAAEIANRNEARAKFRSSEDLVHRLFVCIAGVADQLQTNFAGDLRHILKCVFLMNASSSISTEEQDSEEGPVTAVSVEQESLSSPSGYNDFSRPVENAEEALSTGWESPASPMEVESPPPWIPDDMAPRCMSCEAVFTVVRRRHHCRNCGKVFCARCSSNSVPLPRYGHEKPVRVCNRCFLYQVTPFTLEELATRS